MHTVKKLVKLCSNFHLKVANGRTPGDLLGNFTCFTPRGPSTVDLVIADEGIFKIIKKLKVLTPHYTSVHCPLSFTLNCKVSLSTDEVLESPPPRLIWDVNKEVHFIQGLHRALPNINSAFFSNIKSFSELDTAVKNVSNVILSSAKFCMKTINPRKNTTRNFSKKPWFGSTCQSLKKRLKLLAINLTKYPKDPYLRGQFITTKKYYRKLVKDGKFTYQKSEISKLSDLAASNPKEFWSHLKRITGKASRTCDVSSDSWVEHF